MLEQIQAPSEDGRKVQLMLSVGTTVLGVGMLTGGIGMAGAAAVSASLVMAGLGGLVVNLRRAHRTD